MIATITPTANFSKPPMGCFDSRAGGAERDEAAIARMSASRRRFTAA